MQVESERELNQLQRTETKIDAIRSCWRNRYWLDQSNKLLSAIIIFYQWHLMISFLG